MPLLKLFFFSDGLRYNANWLEIAQRRLVDAWAVSETSQLVFESDSIRFKFLPSGSYNHYSP